MRKAARCFLALNVAFALFLPGCGSEPPSDTPQTSGLAKRVLAASEFFGNVQVLDATEDRASGFTVKTAAGTEITGRPTLMAGNASVTAAFDSTSNAVNLIDNGLESVRFRTVLEGFTESIALSSDSRRLYAAIRNAGRINVVDVTNGTLGTPITGLPGVRRVALSPNGSKLLAFSDDSDSVVVVNTADNAVTTIAGFNRPFTAVFSPDNGRVYVLNCGGECGGSPQASVGILDLTSNTIVGGPINVGGATVGLLDGNTLYVAGNNGTAGALDAVNVSASSTQQFSIGDGLHTHMALASNGKLYIGARACSTGCLSIFNTGTRAASVVAGTGNITSIDPISGRNVVYLVESGNIRIFDTVTDALQARQIDLTGVVSVLKEVE